jgi:hypothetical protein
MKISRRLAKGWSKSAENENKERCDIDGAKLWIGPGNQAYCDLVHDSKGIKSKDVVASKKKKVQSLA